MRYTGSEEGFKFVILHNKLEETKYFIAARIMWAASFNLLIIFQLNKHLFIYLFTDLLYIHLFVQASWSRGLRCIVLNP